MGLEYHCKECGATALKPNVHPPRYLWKVVLFMRWSAHPCPFCGAEYGFYGRVS